MSSLRWLATLSTVLALLGSTGATGRESASTQLNSRTTSSAENVAVYQFNVHKMQNDWKAWIDHVAASPDTPVPDIILVQDFPKFTALTEDQDRADFIKYLETTFGAKYAAKWATHGDPAIGTERAVIWRGGTGGRFTLVDWRVLNTYGGTNGECARPRNNAKAIQVKLRDGLNVGKIVTAASFKASPPSSPDACAWTNIEFMNSKLKEAWPTSAPGADLLIMGTDTNAPDRVDFCRPADQPCSEPNKPKPDYSYECWYEGTLSVLAGGGCNESGNRHYGDPIFDLCSNETNLHDCLDRNFTLNLEGAGRIDFIFAKRGEGGPASFADPSAGEGDALDPTTLPRGETTPCSVDKKKRDGNDCFSDHRAVEALVNY